MPPESAAVLTEIPPVFLGCEAQGFDRKNAIAELRLQLFAWDDCISHVSYESMPQGGNGYGES